MTTVAGSAISCSLLAYLGQRAYQVAPGLVSDPEGLVHFVKSQSRLILLVVVIFAILYFAAHWMMHHRRTERR
jgi:hypothetical protein